MQRTIFAHYDAVYDMAVGHQRSEIVSQWYGDTL